MSDNNPITATPVNPPKKRSTFKRTLVYTLVLAALGGSGYLAYQQGAMDAYLPNVLKSSVATQPDTTPAVVASAPMPTPPADNPIVSDAQPAANNAANAGVTPNLNPPAANAAPAVTPSAPVTIAINGAPANAIFTAYDAQWQWHSIEQSFKSQGDIAATLQQTQALKANLQSSNAAPFAPTITALTQVEAQLQAWLPLQTATYLSALQQTIVDVDGMVIQTEPTEDLIPTTTANSSWWQRVLASLKNIIQIKRVDEQKNTAALSASTTALVKQSILARLNSAQWAAQTGQWQQAQSHAKAAQALATEWADVSSLVKLKPLLDVASFPVTPDFATVNGALTQARTQLVNDAHAAQALPAPTPAPAAPANPAAKGGA